MTCCVELGEVQLGATRAANFFAEELRHGVPLSDITVGLLSAVMLSANDLQSEDMQLIQAQLNLLWRLSRGIDPATFKTVAPNLITELQSCSSC